MNSVTTFKLSTTAAAETIRLGKVIGRLLRNATVIELVGDIGSGKTTLAQGIIAGMGFSEDTPSPTFTVGRVYPVRDGMQLHHFDFYRLQGHDVATEELVEALQDTEAVILVEWAGNGGAQLPQQRLRIIINPEEAEQDRAIVIESLAPELHYVIKELRNVYHIKN